MPSQPPHPPLSAQQPSALRQDAASGLHYRVLQADTAAAPQLLLLLLHGVGVTSPQLVGGFGLLSGRILPEIAPPLAVPQDLATLAGFISHGEFDDKLPLAWAEKAHRWLDELGVPHQLQLYPAGHQLTAAMVQDFCRWLAARWLH